MSGLFAREFLVKKAVLALNLIWTQLRLLGTTNLHDAAVISEDFFAAFLNCIIKDSKLKNLNQISATYPGIDLGDMDNGICYQVTAQTSSGKLQKTINQYDLNGYSSTYPHLRILIIGQKNKGGYPKLVPPTGVAFAQKTKSRIDGITALHFRLLLGDG
jgi:hypothetical protein